MKLPPLNTLPTFLVAAQKLNFSQAGLELNITHAAVSNQMKRLEDWFGRKLFERSGRGLRLTTAGREFLAVVETTLAPLSAASEKLRVLRDRKRISVACLPSIATRWLVPALGDFIQRHPGVAVELSYAEAYQPFDPEKHDVLITHLEELPERVQAVSIFNRASRPVASAAYVRERAQGIEGRLEEARLLHDASTQDWEDWFAIAGFHPARLSHGPVFPDFNFLFAAVLAGHGVALCPVEVFAQEISRGDLVVLSDIATRTDQSYYILTAERRAIAVNNFVKWFQGRVHLNG